MADLNSTSVRGNLTVTDDISEKGYKLSDTYQAKDSNLTSIAGLSSGSTTGFLRKTAANTWELDTKSYTTTSTAQNMYGVKTWRELNPGPYLESTTRVQYYGIDITDSFASTQGSIYKTTLGAQFLSLARKNYEGTDLDRLTFQFDESSGIYLAYTDTANGSRNIYFPINSGTLALTSDIASNVPGNQMAVSIVGNATTNVNGRVFQNYTATLTTAGGYTFYQIYYNGGTVNETRAKEYMKYMTGSEFVPKYNYDFPKQSIFMFADRSTWKAQWSSNDGLRLYRLTTPFALTSDIPTIVANPSGAASTDLSKLQIGSTNYALPAKSETPQIYEVDNTAESFKSIANKVKANDIIVSKNNSGVYWTGIVSKVDSSNFYIAQFYDLEKIEFIQYKVIKSTGQRFGVQFFPVTNSEESQYILSALFPAVTEMMFEDNLLTIHFNNDIFNYWSGTLEKFPITGLTIYFKVNNYTYTAEFLFNDSGNISIDTFEMPNGIIPDIDECVDDYIAFTFSDCDDDITGEFSFSYVNRATAAVIKTGGKLQATITAE